MRVTLRHHLEASCGHRSNAVNGGSELNHSRRTHDNLNITTLRFHELKQASMAGFLGLGVETYPITSASSRARHFDWLLTHCEFSARIARGAHVREFERARFAKVVESTSNHDLRFARQYSVTSDFKGLQCSSAE